MVASAAGATVASAAIQLSLVHPVIVRSKCMPSPTAGGDQSAVDVVENFKEQLQQLTLEENVRKESHMRCICWVIAVLLELGGVGGGLILLFKQLVIQLICRLSPDHYLTPRRE
jgi:hypothetical protein